MGDLSGAMKSSVLAPEDKDVCRRALHDLEKERIAFDPATVARLVLSRLRHFERPPLWVGERDSISRGGPAAWCQAFPTGRCGQQFVERIQSSRNAAKT